MDKLPKEFFQRDGLTLSKKLLGKRLVKKTNHVKVSGKIVETEAYIGPEDKASHAYDNLRSERTEVQYKKGGYAYVYMIYGMYYCFNVVVADKEKPEVVLIRALEPIDGIELMEENKSKNEVNLCDGPGKLCDALKITKNDNGKDLTNDEIYITECENLKKNEIKSTKRINIDYAEKAINYPWRFIIKNNKYISKRR